MNSHKPGQSRRLHGQTILLSASVPSVTRSDKFRRIPDSQVQIEEAVVSLTRAILSEGGRLVSGGHPSISVLVGLVAGEYALPMAVEEREGDISKREENESHAALIQIFQSEAYRDHLPDETWQLFRYGFATIHWTPAIDGERYSPEVRDRPQCPKSLEAMRRAMIQETGPSAMICIGGMEGLFEEAKLYRELNQRGRIYTFEMTGGAASYLTEHVNGVEVIDRLILTSLDESPPEWIKSENEDEGYIHEDNEAERQIRVIPYPIISQLLVQKMADREGHSSGRAEGR